MKLPELKFNFNKSGFELIPHREPFLFVDKLISADESGAIGEYTFTQDKNDFFRGHFESKPIVPGVILVEAMAQVACCGISARYENIKNFYLVEMTNVKFREPFIPNDKLTTIVKVKKEHLPFCEYELFGLKNFSENVDSTKYSVQATIKCIVGDVDI